MRPFFKWFADGELNVSYNCIDRHLAQSADKVALILKPTVAKSKILPTPNCTAVCVSSPTALKSLGVVKGDRVVIYMPMVAEAIVAMQACARIGAIHSVVFGGFSAGAVKTASKMPAPSW